MILGGFEDDPLSLKGRRLPRPYHRRRRSSNSSSSALINCETEDFAKKNSQGERGGGHRLKVLKARPAWPKTPPTIPSTFYKSGTDNKVSKT